MTLHSLSTLGGTTAVREETCSLDRLRAVDAVNTTMTAPRCATSVVAPGLIRLPLRRGKGE